MNEIIPEGYSASVLATIDAKVREAVAAERDAVMAIVGEVSAEHINGSVGAYDICAEIARRIRERGEREP